MYLLTYTVQHGTIVETHQPTTAPMTTTTSAPIETDASIQAQLQATLDNLHALLDRMENSGYDRESLGYDTIQELADRTSDAIVFFTEE